MSLRKKTKESLSPRMSGETYHRKREKGRAEGKKMEGKGK